MSITVEQVIEAALLTAGEPLTLERLEYIVEDFNLGKDELHAAIAKLNEQLQSRHLHIKEIASGYCIQAMPDLAPWLQRLFEEKPPRYSRAFLETLSIIAYKQPVTRSDIEQIRGVAVSPHIIKTLMEHDWIRIIAYKEVPGRPALFATTKKFLDHFNLKNLSDLPSLPELKQLITPEEETTESTEVTEISDSEIMTTDVFEVTTQESETEAT